ncbi:MAG: alpha-amylase family glycosyl hydrolase [Lachnospiraceae bacterium]|nr:alpha-amylase family glycosyl hydrolase [Lachnospiraceae bacterium]
MTMLLVLVTLVGCGDNASNGQKAESYEYDYEQELNIIDDNYRNYYEIFVYSFYDSDGDGIGDLRGVIEKLDYIQEMGFNGIWLMPIMPSTTYHKYDVIDYKDIDPEYGTLEDFQELVDECHERDIRLIIDFVINHSSAQNQWFLEACDYLRTLDEGEEPDVTACPYVDYYHFSTEKIDSTYYGVAGVDWWYEGSFWDQMPDLNLESEALRGEIEDIAKFWIDMGVDGFRMDAALHFEEEDDDANNEILNWIYSYGKSLNPEFYMVSEVWASEKTITDYYGSLTPSMFNFDAASAEGKIMKAARNGSAVGFVQAMLRYQEDFSAVNPEYIDAPFLTNHDQVRVANALTSNPDNMKMAAGLLMTMSGSPFVYYGEEIGMKSSGTKDENKRLPMRWSEADDTGMTKGPSGSDKNAEQTFAALDEQLSDPDSIVNYYRRAIRIRNENPEIARGTITLVEELSEGNQAAITKTYEGSTIGILYNTADRDATMDLQGTALEGMEIRGYMTLHGEVVTLENGEVSLPAQSICILK